MSCNPGRGWWCYLLILLGGCSVDIPSTFYSTQVESGGTDAEGSVNTPDDVEQESDDTKEEAGDDASGCTSIGDCPLDESNPCLQPNCVAGVCGEQPAPPDTDCLNEELDAACAVATCSSGGECELTLSEAGTDCLPDGVESAEQCQSYTCNGEGLCIAAPSEDGIPCGAGDTPCEIRQCAGGVCEKDPEVCNDFSRCSEDRCIQYTQCPGIDVNPVNPGNIIGCFFKMRTGEWDCTTADCDAPFREYDLAVKNASEAVLGEMAMVAWCNADYKNKAGHDIEGCLPPEDWDTFKAHIDVNPDGADTGVCYSDLAPAVADFVCDDINSCTGDACAPGDENAEPGTGCVFTPKNVDDECTGTEFCFNGDAATCQESATGDGTLVCERDGDNLEEPCALDSPCVVLECNQENGVCEPKAKWEEGAPVPACVADAVGGFGATPENGAICGLGKCERCEEGQPNCNGARCLPDLSLGVACTQNTSDLCSELKSYGPASCAESPHSLSNECLVPCYGWKGGCLDCFSKVGANLACAMKFRDDFLLDFCGPNEESPNVFPEGEAQANDFLSSPQWQAAVSECFASVLPAHLGVEEIEEFFPAFVTDVFKPMQNCVAGILNNSEFFKSLDPDQQAELPGCSSAAVSAALKEGKFGPCQEPDSNCAAMPAVSGFGAAVCSDDAVNGVQASFAYFGTLSFRYSAPFCIRPCDIQSGAPETMCSQSSCVDVSDL